MKPTSLARLQYISKWITGIVLIVAGLLFAGTAHSYDREIQTFPGNMCRHYGPQGQDVDLEPRWQRAIGLKNKSNSDLYVICPIVKRLFSKMYGAYVVMSSSKGECSIYIRQIFGRSTMYIRLKRIEFFAPNWVYSLKESVYWRTQHHTLAFFCKLPPGAVVLSYLYDGR